MERRWSIFWRPSQRDELFQIEEEELYLISLGILHLQERQRVALFTRTDAFERFVSCFVYVPTEAYNTTLRKRIEMILLKAFEGTDTSFNAQIGNGSSPVCISPSGRNAAKSQALISAISNIN